MYLFMHLFSIVANNIEAHISRSLGSYFPELTQK
jgi:hypothetical protein